MGTSSIFNGRNDRSPLLPDDYDAAPAMHGMDKPAVTWQTVKSDMSKYIKSEGSYGSSRHIVRQYIRASGGVQRLARSSTAGIRAGSNLGSFLKSIRSDGVYKTFQDLGVDFEGKSIHEVFSELVNVLAPSANSKEDIVAREAVLSALSKLYDYIECNNINIDNLNEMPIELMNEAICDYVGSYIWILVMNDLESRLEKFMADTSKAYQIEQEFKDMIMGIVHVEFENNEGIMSKNVGDAVQDLYKSCLHTLEDVI